MMFKILSTFVLLVFVSSNYDEPNIDIFPMPQTAEFGTQKMNLKNPCAILYTLQSPVQQYKHIETIIKHYQLKAFGCHTANFLTKKPQMIKMKGIDYFIKIQIRNPELKSVYTTMEEMYQLRISQSQTSIMSLSYVGFVRALETFTQTLSCSQKKNSQCQFQRSSIIITDSPQFAYRGIMIDTARHYLPKHLILETIDAMMYNKMNVLHWHITDDDSFPLVLKSHPELAQHGAFSPEEVYTTEDVKQIVEYAMIRGVRIVPQFSTPARSSSWVRADKYKAIKECQYLPLNERAGGFNLTNSETYTFLRSVFKQILQLFPDKMIHLGGQSLAKQCVEDPSNINHNEEYRKKQRQILKDLDNSRTYIYYYNNISVEPSDIIHTMGQLPDVNNKIIFSNREIHNLARGVGNKNGYSTGGYSVWMEIYSYRLNKTIENYQNKDNVIGSVMLLQSQTSNQYTHHIKLWMRSCSLAEMLWNSQLLHAKPSALRRLTRHQRVMDKRGIPTAPITGQICEINPDFC